MESKVCIICGKTFYKDPNGGYWKERKYCGKRCRGDDPILNRQISEKMKGRKLSEEHRINISEGRKGIKLSLETKEKLRKITKGRKGSKSSNWKGGISSSHEHKLMKQRKWHKDNPDKVKRIQMKRKAVMKAGGELPLERIQLVYEDNIKRYGTLTCYLCENPIQFGKDTLEHKTPLSRGGTNEYHNLAIACCDCNSKKHTKTEEEYRKEFILWQKV